MIASGQAVKSNLFIHRVIVIALTTPKVPA